MQIKFQLHAHGPWHTSHEPLVYDTALGKYIYESQSIHNEENLYFIGKLSVAKMIMEAVEECSEIPTACKTDVIDAICHSWVTKVNFAIIEGNPCASLKIPITTGGGLQVLTDSIHYWTPNHTDLGDIRGLLKAQLKIIIQKVCKAVNSVIPDTDLAVKFVRIFLIDTCNQFVLEITE